MRIRVLIAALVSAIMSVGLIAGPANAGQFDDFNYNGWWDVRSPGSSVADYSHIKWTYPNWQAGCQGQGANDDEAAIQFLWLTPDSRTEAPGTSFFSGGNDVRAKEHVKRALSIFGASAKLVLTNSWKVGPVPRVVVNPLSGGECTIQFRLVNNVPDYLTNSIDDFSELSKWLEESTTKNGVTTPNCSWCGREDRKYHVLIDRSADVLGAASFIEEDIPDSTNRNNYGDASGNWSSYGQYSYTWARQFNGAQPMALEDDHANTIAHEIAHMLGSVMETAPDHCKATNPDWGINHLRIGFELMYQCPSGWQEVRTHEKYEQRMDPDEKNYFGYNSPGSWLSSHWNLVNSQFLWSGIPSPTGPVWPGWSSYNRSGPLEFNIVSHENPDFRNKQKSTHDHSNHAH